jgi:hypothetical protein
LSVRDERSDPVATQVRPARAGRTGPAPDDHGHLTGRIEVVNVNATAFIDCYADVAE